MAAPRMRLMLLNSGARLYADANVPQRYDARCHASFCRRYTFVVYAIHAFNAKRKQSHNEGNARFR
jgi:hypothetical protein